MTDSSRVDLDALEIRLRSHLMTSEESADSLAAIAELRAARVVVERARVVIDSWIDPRTGQPDLSDDDGTRQLHTALAEYDRLSTSRGG